MSSEGMVSDCISTCFGVYYFVKEIKIFVYSIGSRVIPMMNVNVFVVSVISELILNVIVVGPFGTYASTLGFINIQGGVRTKHASWFDIFVSSESLVSVTYGKLNPLVILIEHVLPFSVVVEIVNAVVLVSRTIKDSTFKTHRFPTTDEGGSYLCEITISGCVNAELNENQDVVMFLARSLLMLFRLVNIDNRRN